MVKAVRDFDLKPARDYGLSRHDRHRSVFRESGILESAVRAAWWVGVRGYLYFVHWLRVHGREHLPAAGPFVIAANHASHLDALVIGSTMPLAMRDRACPLAAGDHFFESPRMAAFSATVLNALPVWRKKVGKQGLTDLRTRLIEDRCAYILFPEGTRSRDGKMTSFKAGLGMLVAGAEIPVVPCLLGGTHAAFPPGYWLPRFHRITVRFGEPLHFANVENRRHGWETIARQTEAAVRALAVPRRGR